MDYTHGYSANVALTLVVNGLRLAISHLEPNGIVVRDPCEPIPPGKAKIYFKIDGSTKRRRVYLPEGVSGPRQLVPLSNAPF